MKKPKERFKTYKNVFDEFTLRGLFKLSSQGHFDDLKSPVSIGKEANIFSALKDDKLVIIKIYRLETCDFNRMYDYIKYDPRYQGLKKNRRRIIFAWAQREYRNLLKARQADVKVPTPFACFKNIVVMEFIGKKEPALKLKDAVPKNKKKFFEITIKNIKNLYKAGLVHADLSSFNILNFDEMPVFIDFSQCTPLQNPNSEDYLKRDIRNICNFFKKHGLKVDEAKTLEKIKI